ncbi:hypothetical protein Daus18300_001854 [Diaporthe australafricana]|uniref:SGNH hydrolase-type esterase domain-containing protein n=1 Tax=Diaporthe australafricana TaxID=127596 RepID=A0ABR3XUA3_9PEZI
MQFSMWSVLAATALVGSGLAQNKIRIMPLGDSITEITCWRAYVWDDLVAANVSGQAQYVGSQNSNPQNCKPKTTNWDQHNEGHSGWLAIDIANSYIATWAKNTPADIVMFMLGTNDVTRGHTTAEITAAYTKIVQTVRQSNPKAKFIVDEVIPLSFNNNAIVALNNAIPSWAATLNTTESPIVIADCYTGFTTSDLRDGVHPNESGDRKIQAKISPLLINYVKQSLAA